MDRRWVEGEDGVAGEGYFEATDGELCSKGEK